LASLAGLVFLLIVASLVREGLPAITWRFLVGGARGGNIGPELFNTAFMVGAALLVTVPLGLLAAIFQTEYLHGRGRRVRSADRLSATLLSAPTIVIALVVYRVAVGWWHWPVSVLTGVLALTVINWPFMLTISKQALHHVPEGYREASLALGATRMQTALRVVVPAALGELVDGWGLAFARLAGESAALIVTAGVNVSAHWSILGPGETLAVHIWYIRTEGVGVSRDAQAAATGVALMVLITVVVWVAGRAARWAGRPHSAKGGRSEWRR
jgi:phosphate transport system permease protein